MKAILIDDELLALNYLEHQLAHSTDVQILGKYTDPYEGKAAVEGNEVDIVFLDIQIPELNGMELAELLLESKPYLHIVFVTAYDEFALHAFELDVLDYVLKPVRQERLLKTIQRINQRMNEEPRPSLPRSNALQMRLFQQVTILDDQEENILLRWRTTKVQQLFLYLLHHRGKMVDKFSLIELLWPEYDPKKALAQLYTATYHIRKTLEPFGSHFKIKNMTDGYMLMLNNISLDVDEFERFIQADLALSEATISNYERAMALYKGEYLEGFDYVWAEGERQRLQALWVQTSIQLIDWFMKEQQFEKALQYSWDVFQRYPLEEEASFLLMKIHAKMGNRTAVVRQYNQLQSLLLEELNELPSSKITDWFHKWRETKE